MKWNSFSTVAAVLAIAYLLSGFVGELLESCRWFGGVTSLIACLLLTIFILNEYLISQGHHLQKGEGLLLLLIMALVVCASELLRLPFVEQANMHHVVAAAAAKLFLIALALSYVHLTRKPATAHGQ